MHVTHAIVIVIKTSVNTYESQQHNEIFAACQWSYDTSTTEMKTKKMRRRRKRKRRRSEINIFVQGLQFNYVF